MKRTRTTLTLTIAAILMAGVVALPAKDPKPVKPGKKDRCLTCGMFPHKYPQWAAQVHWSDGTRNYFDGCKCMFRALQDMKKHAPGKTSADIAAVYVTNYYTSKPIDGTAAFYVIGSDVLGPMGRELIPFATEDDAKEFLKDHKGKKILRFPEITPAVLKPLLHKKKMKHGHEEV